MFLKLSQISQENTVLDSLFNNVAGFQACNFMEKIQKQQRCSLKRAVLKNIAINTGKHLFVKVIGLKACNVIKKRAPHGCFSVNIVKFVRTPTLKNICEQLLLKILQQWCFPIKLAKFLRTPILKNICKRLLLFASAQNTITNSGGEFGLYETLFYAIQENNYLLPIFSFIPLFSSILQQMHWVKYARIGVCSGRYFPV